MPRPKGSPNKVTTETREHFKALLEGELPHLKAALESLRLTDPDAYLGHVWRVGKFCVPELARLEHVGNDGGAITVQIVKYGETDK